MTTSQIHQIINMHGLIKGNVIHRTKEWEPGRTVGLDEIRYEEGRKSFSQRVRNVYNQIIK